MKGWPAMGEGEGDGGGGAGDKGMIDASSFLLAFLFVFDLYDFFLGFGLFCYEKSSVSSNLLILKGP